MRVTYASPSYFRANFLTRSSLISKKLLARKKFEEKIRRDFPAACSQCSRKMVYASQLELLSRYLLKKRIDDKTSMLDICQRKMRGNSNSLVVSYDTRHPVQRDYIIFRCSSERVKLLFYEYGPQDHLTDSIKLIPITRRSLAPLHPRRGQRRRQMEKDIPPISFPRGKTSKEDEPVRIIDHRWPVAVKTFLAGERLSRIHSLAYRCVRRKAKKTGRGGGGVGRKEK